MAEQPPSVQGSVRIADPEPAMPPPQPPPVSTGVPTSVEASIPESVPQAEIQGTNAYIPQVVPAMETQGQVPPPAAPARGGSLVKKLLIGFGILLLLVVLIFVGRWIFGSVAGQKDATISYWGLWENEAIVSSVISDFEGSHPNIKVEYVKSSPKQYRERLQSAISRGEGPDVFRFHNTWVAMIFGDLSTVPPDIMTPAEFQSTFHKVAVNDLVAGELIYGLPLMVDGLGLYINEDLFANAGVSPPSTWEDVLTIAPQLTVKSGNEIITSAIALGTTGNVEHFSDIVATMMMQNGADLKDPSSDAAQEALLFYRKFSDPSDPVYTWNDTLDNSIYAFSTGRVAMILAPSWRTFDITQMNPDLRFKIVPVPQLPGHTVTWGSYWVEGVSNKSKNQQAAWEFAKYLTSKEGALKLYSEASKARLFGEPYARVDLSSSISTDPYSGAYVSQADDAKSFPLASRTFDNGINDQMIKYLEDAINAVSQGTAPSAALQTAASGFAQVLQKYGISTSAPPTQ